MPWSPFAPLSESSEQSARSEANGYVTTDDEHDRKRATATGRNDRGPDYSETTPATVATAATAMVTTCVRKNGFEECQPK